MTETIVRIVYDNFDAILSQFADDVDDETMRTALQIEADTKRAAPVDTGNLRNSYQTEKTGRGSAAVYTNTEYALFVEMGTSKQAAQPHLGPAAENQRYDYIERIRRIGQGLR